MKSLKVEEINDSRKKGTRKQTTKKSSLKKKGKKSGSNDISLPLKNKDSFIKRNFAVDRRQI